MRLSSELFAVRLEKALVHGPAVYIVLARVLARLANAHWRVTIRTRMHELVTQACSVAEYGHDRDDESEDDCDCRHHK